jgi:hypothetical protein
MALESFKTQLTRTLAISRSTFDKLFADTEKRLNAALRSGQPLRYFKGKWLVHVLQRHLETAQKPPDALTNSAGDKVSAALLAQVGNHPNCRCCAPFTSGINVLVGHLA